MPKRTTRTSPRIRSTILRVTELERRDTPAWWTVAAPVPPEGTVGVTDATHAGSLVSNPDYAPANGAATVWADTATLAVAKALTGTISVTLSGQTVEHAFGPATVGATAADHKAFLAVVSGTSVALAFEDMAGQPGCDYDYNDRSWSGVTVTGTSEPVIDTGNWTWANPDTGESVTVQMTVTAAASDQYRWHYDVTNVGFSTIYPQHRGVGKIFLYVADATKVTQIATSQSDWVSVLDAGIGMVAWRTPNTNDGSVIPMGGSAWFEFQTPVAPVVPATGSSCMASIWTEPEEAGILPVYAEGYGVAKGPGKATADITIDGDLTVGATNPKITGSNPVVTEFSPKNNTNEDSPGGLVVRNSDNNNAPRQQITIQKLKDGAGNPVQGGQLTLTVPGQVTLFDAATGGNPVATGTVFDNNNLR